MFRGRIRIGTTLVAAALALTACASLTDEFQQRAAYRWGPNPAIQSGEVAAVLDNQIFVLNYIRDHAPILPPPTTGRYYYEIAQWGFNVGRQDCTVYMNTLFKINRDRARNGSIITAVGTYTAAIVTAGSYSASTLSILAAAFGLTSALNDAVTSSYLFTEAPGLIAKKVKDMQDAYQASLGPADIATPAMAYAAIQNYYNICLPQAIEGVLLEAVASSTPSSAPPAGAQPGPQKTVNLSVSSASQPAGAQPGPRKTGSLSVNTTGQPGGGGATTSTPRQQIGPPARSPRPTNQAFAALLVNFDPKIHSTFQVQAVLRKLCVPEADLNTVDPKMNALIQVYQQTVVHPATGRLTAPEIAQLNNAKDCVPTDQHRNFYEETQLPSDGVQSSGAISLLNKAVAAAQELHGDASTADIRKRIAEVRAQLGAKLKLQSPFLSDQFSLDLANELAKLRSKPSN